jgi:hypothetical protein
VAPFAARLLLAPAVLTLAACGGGGQQTTASESDRSAELAVTAIVHDWYASARVAACDQMTDRMLQFGWQMSGDAGRQACRAAVAAAEPVETVEVSPLSGQGSSAQIKVSYAVNGEVRADVVSVVRRGSDWLIDGVKRVTVSAP